MLHLKNPKVRGNWKMSNIIICCTCNICPRAVEQATQATTRENLSSGSPTNRVTQTSLFCLTGWLENWNFARSKSRYDSSQKATIKVVDETARMHRLVCAFIVTNHWRKVFLVAVQLLYVSFYHERLENKMQNLIIVKYNSDRIVICAVSSKHLQCVCRHTIVRTEIQWTTFFFFKMSLMINFWTKILHIHIIKHRLIYNCIFEYLW